MSLPSVCGYNLIGDSMFLRLAIKHADEAPPFTGYQSEWGFCRGGKTIRQLNDDLSALYGGNTHRVVVLIGTNDILKMAHSDFQLGKEKSRLVHDITTLRNKLARKCVDIKWCTLPPIPRLHQEDGIPNERYKCLLEAVNEKISSLKNEYISIVDLSSAFLQQNNMELLFERYMGSGQSRRVDGIHWNDKGMEIAYKQIKNEIVNSFNGNKDVL